MKKLILVCASVAVLVGCQKPGQNTYKAGEVGVSRAVEFGTVQNRREVAIQGKNSGTGMLLGAGVGAGGGSYVGNGSGSDWAMAGAAVAGAVAGHLIEQEMQDSTGYEYVVRMQSGKTKTIVQENIEGDVVFKRGDKVMLQYCDSGEYQRKCAPGGEFQRLLPVDEFPPYERKKRKSK